MPGYRSGSMGESRSELIRKLRVAFTAAELRKLEEYAAFSEALNKCDGSPAAVGELVQLGGSLLSQGNREKSNLTPQPRRDAA